MRCISVSTKAMNDRSFCLIARINRSVFDGK